MLKRDEIADPNSCWNKAKDDEIVFVFRETDPSAPAAIRRWVTDRLMRGLNVATDDKIIEAQATAALIQQRTQKKATAIKE